MSDSVIVKHHRTVTVLGVDGEKPALELLCVEGEVKVTLLPRNSTNRQPVKLADLTDAVSALKS